MSHIASNATSSSLKADPDETAALNRHKLENFCTRSQYDLQVDLWDHMQMHGGEYAECTTPKEPNTQYRRNTDTRIPKSGYMALGADDDRPVHM